MRPRIWMVAAVVVGAVAFVAIGHATTLPDASRQLGTNQAAVAHCDTDGVTIVPNLAGANVVSVTVGQIAAGCGTGTLSVSVNNGSANSTGSVAVPAGGGTVTPALASTVPVVDSMEIDVSISGP